MEDEIYVDFDNLKTLLNELNYEETKELKELITKRFDILRTEKYKKYLKDKTDPDLVDKIEVIYFDDDGISINFKDANGYFYSGDKYFEWIGLKQNMKINWKFLVKI